MTAGEMKHTAGWFVDGCDNRLTVQSDIEDICHLDWGGDNAPFEVVRDRARLIAAAPELLEALRGMLTATDHWNDWEPGAKERATAIAAIAKATGATP